MIYLSFDLKFLNLIIIEYMESNIKQQVFSRDEAIVNIMTPVICKQKL